MSGIDKEFLFGILSEVLRGNKHPTLKFEKAKVLHLALFDADYPYIVPLHYGYEYTEGILIFYMHCAKEGHKLDLIRSNPNVCIEVESDVELISGREVACKYGA